MIDAPIRVRGQRKYVGAKQFPVVGEDETASAFERIGTFLGPFGHLLVEDVQIVIEMDEIGSETIHVEELVEHVICAACTHANDGMRVLGMAEELPKAVESRIGAISHAIEHLAFSRQFVEFCARHTMATPSLVDSDNEAPSSASTDHSVHSEFCGFSRG